jgi:HEAT repeat protein
LIRDSERNWRDLDILAIEEPPEDGVEGAFSSRFAEMLDRNGPAFIDGLPLNRKRLSVLTQAEALKLMGRVNHPNSERKRRSVLLAALKSSNVAIRDAAAIGLSYLGDPNTIEAVQDAAATESDLALREFLIDIVKELNKL